MGIICPTYRGEKKIELLTGKSDLKNSHLLVRDLTINTSIPRDVPPIKEGCGFFTHMLCFLGVITVLGEAYVNRAETPKAPTTFSAFHVEPNLNSDNQTSALWILQYIS